jgi:transcriptional regulator with XRE-family HTH domain
MDKRIFAVNLKILRRDLGLTQHALADELRIKRASVGAWEEGRAYPSIPLLVRLCEYLKVDNMYKFLTAPIK